MDKRHQPREAGTTNERPPRQDTDRRARGERRRHAGLLELRARREGIDGDRRQGDPDRSARSRLLSLWRRVRP